MKFKDFIKNNRFAVLIAVTGIIVFANTFRNGFVYDDKAFIVDNKSIRELRNIPDFFISAPSFSARGDFSIYRPLVTVSFALDYQLWKQNPFGYHILNILFHILCGLMVFRVLKLLIKEELPAFFGALLFITNPIQVEAVSWIAGRGNAICLFLCLLSFYYFACSGNRSDKEKRKKLWIAVIIYVVALLTKEMAICFPLLLVAYDFLMFPSNWSKLIYRKKNDFSFIKDYIPFIIVSVLYILLRYFATGKMSQTAYWGGGIIPTLLTMAKVFYYYVKLIILPFNLNVDHDIPVSFSILDPFVLFSFCFIFASLFISLKIYRYSKLATLGMFWFVIALLPVSNIVPIQALIAERFLYMPSVGYSMVFAVLISRLTAKVRFKNTAVFLMIAVVFCFSILTIKRNGVWKSDYTLWSKTLNSSGNNFKALTSLAIHYAEKEDYEKAIELYIKSIKANPNYAVTHNNLGNTYQKTGKYQDAINEYDTAIGLDKNYYEAYSNKGNAYKKMGNNEEAIFNYQKALIIKDNYADARFNIGVIYGEMDRKAEALELYKQVVQKDQYKVEAYNNMAIIYRDRGEVDKAVQMLLTAIKNNPEYIEAHYNIAMIYNVGQVDKMIKELKKVIEIDSKFKEAHYNLGVAYEKKGMYKDAMEEYKKELEIRPDYSSAYKNLGIMYYNSGDYEKTVFNWENYVRLNPGANDADVVRKEINRLKANISK